MIFRGVHVEKNTTVNKGAKTWNQEICLLRRIPRPLPFPASPSPTLDPLCTITRDLCPKDEINQYFVVLTVCLLSLHARALIFRINKPECHVGCPSRVAKCHISPRNQCKLVPWDRWLRDTLLTRSTSVLLAQWVSKGVFESMWGRESS